MDAKPWYTSKTIWIALATGIIGLIQGIQPVITDPHVAGWCVTALGALNWFVRMTTVGKILK